MNVSLLGQKKSLPTPTLTLPDTTFNKIFLLFSLIFCWK